MRRRKIQSGLAERLTQLVKDNVKAGKEFTVAEAAAYEKAAKAVRDGLREKYRPRDMAVLRKFGLAEVGQTIKIARLVKDTQEVWQFVFRGDDDIPDVPTLVNTRHRHPVLDLGADAAELTVTWHRAFEAKKEDEARRRMAYFTLINSGTAKEIAAAWPEAAPVIEKYMKRTLPAPVTKSTMDTIKADMAERGVEA